MILIEEIHPQIKFYKTSIKMPFPLSDRYFAHYIYEFNPYENRTVFFYLPCFSEDHIKIDKSKEQLAIIDMAIWDFELINNHQFESENKENLPSKNRRLSETNIYSNNTDCVRIRFLSKVNPCIKNFPISIMNLFGDSAGVGPIKLLKQLHLKKRDTI